MFRGGVQTIPTLDRSTLVDAAAGSPPPRMHDAAIYGGRATICRGNTACFRFLKVAMLPCTAVLLRFVEVLLPFKEAVLPFMAAALGAGADLCGARARQRTCEGWWARTPSTRTPSATTRPRSEPSAAVTCGSRGLCAASRVRSDSGGGLEGLSEGDHAQGGLGRTLSGVAVTGRWTQPALNATVGPQACSSQAGPSAFVARAWSVIRGCSGAG
eukprot:1087961-Rhodomonas_salina.1